MSFKVLIVDDHEVARVGLSYLLQGLGFEIPGSAKTGGTASALVRSEPCDVVLLDVRMPGEDGLDNIEKLREAKADLPVIIFSAYDNPTYIARAAALGANDYLFKTGDADELAASIRRAANGDEALSNSPIVKIRRIMGEEVDVATLPPAFPLTSREAQVLRHVALGLSNKEIARSLTISVETVKEHVQNILRKINANDRTDAAVKAIKAGIVE